MYVGPGRGLQLSSRSPAPGRVLFIGHHGAYEVANGGQTDCVTIYMLLQLFSGVGTGGAPGAGAPPYSTQALIMCAYTQ